SVLEEWEDTKLFAHSGGSNDAGHPDLGALKLLKKHADDLQFARTDRHGIITVTKKNGEVTMAVSQGSINDFSQNKPPDVVTVNTVPPPPPPPETKEVAAADGIVEVVARVPHTDT